MNVFLAFMFNVAAAARSGDSAALNQAARNEEVAGLILLAIFVPLLALVFFSAFFGKPRQ